ncbi:MAG: hypothetical protein ACRC6V_08940 [Bacteroidales bacterium]
MDEGRKLSIKYKINQLTEGGDLSFIFDLIKKRVAEEILETSPSEVELRNEKYWLVMGIKSLEKEFQGYVNDITRLEENK